MKVSKLIMLLSVLAVFGCKEYEVPTTNVVAMSGRWWVELYIDLDQDGVPVPDELIYTYADFGHYGLSTSNIASNAPDTVLIDDVEGSWPFKMKSKVDVGALEFKNSTSLNLHPAYDGSGETVTVIDGKILKGVATLPSGRKADSIYVRFEFSDDPGNYYIYAGHRDTGQPEDGY